MPSYQLRAQEMVQARSQHTERSSLSLVEVNVVALSDNDNVPRVDTPGGSHQNRQDSIRGIDVSLVLLSQL